MCPPTHISRTTRPRPLLASFSPISLPDKFFPPSHSTQPATLFCGCACLVRVWSVSVVYVVPAWIGGESSRKKTLCKLWEYYETDTGAHKLYALFAYSWHKTLCKYGLNLHNGFLLLPQLPSCCFLFNNKTKVSKRIAV